MYSSLKSVVDWTAAEFAMPVSTYPQAGVPRPFAVVNRVGGTCEYPHDYPRYAIQFWMDSDAEGEAIAFECARKLPALMADERINAVGAAELTQLGYIDDGGGFVWQVAFDLATNIYTTN